AEGDGNVANYWNDVVTFAKSNKIGVKADYLWSRDTQTADSLSYKVPAGSRWKTSQDRGEEVIGGFFAYDTMGRRVRSVTIEAYRWDMNYVVNDKDKTGGDNPKGLAKMILKFYKSDFSTYKEVPLQKSSFAKKLPPGQVFELIGVDGNQN